MNERQFVVAELTKRGWKMKRWPWFINEAKKERGEYLPAHYKDLRRIWFPTGAQPESLIKRLELWIKGDDRVLDDTLASVDELNQPARA